MMENLKWFCEEAEILVNLENDPRFIGEDKDLAVLHNALQTGYKWTFAGKEIIIYKEGARPKAHPSNDGKFLFVAWYEHPEYPNPSNAVIYSADGNVFNELGEIKLLSKLAKETGFTKGDYCLIPRPYKRTHETHIYNAVNVQFGMRYYETREIDFENGCLGQCLYATMD